MYYYNSICFVRFEISFYCISLVFDVSIKPLNVIFLVILILAILNNIEGFSFRSFSCFQKLEMGTKTYFIFFRMIVYVFGLFGVRWLGSMSCEKSVTPGG